MNHSSRATHLAKVAAFSAAIALVGQASAQAPAASSDAASGPSSPLPSCSVRGAIPMNKGVVLHRDPVAESPIATFTGATSPIFATSLPASPRSERARVKTSVGQGAASLRLEGWVLAAALPLFATRDLAVVPGHVSIAKGHRVDLRRVEADGLLVQLAIAGAGGQTVEAKVPCDAVALAPPRVAEWFPPGSARQWITRREVIDLLAEPGGAVVFTLRLGGGAAQTFWSTEQRGVHLRVTSRGDVSLDGWIRLADVQPVKQGELRGRYVPPQVPAGSVVALEDSPPVARVLRETPVHAEADAKSFVLGAAEPGAEVFVLATIGAFSSVLPRGIPFVALERKGFWVASSELVR